MYLLRDGRERAVDGQELVTLWMVKFCDSSCLAAQKIAEVPSRRMKKALLIFLMLALPLQTLAAVERAFTHALASGNPARHELSFKHFIEHSNHVLHHHEDDDDGAAHEDGSPQSVKHILDYDQAGGFHAVIPTTVPMPAFQISETQPVCSMHAMSDCPPRPLFRPPRTLA